MEWAWLVMTHPLVLVACGGGAGSAIRYAVGRWVDARLGATGFPFGTFTVNVAGSFVLGVLALLILERLPANYRGFYLLFGTGFCGGFTTFSTFEWESYKLARDGSWWLLSAYALGSVVCGFVGVLAAVLVVNGVFGKPLPNGQ